MMLMVVISALPVTAVNNHCGRFYVFVFVGMSVTVKMNKLVCIVLANVQFPLVGCNKVDVTHSYWCIL